MTEAGAWPQIARQGLLSTQALLDLFEAPRRQRLAIAAAPRRQSVVLEHPLHGRAVLRDQRPLHAPALARSLTDATVREWLALLNGSVFFWADEARLERLLGAQLFRDRPHDVIVVETARLLERRHDVRVSPINSGYAGRNPARRGRATFEPLAASGAIAPRGSAPRPVVEVVAPGAVPDVAELAVLVERRGGGLRELVWSRAGDVTSI